ncbi:anoctamin-9 isoform X3 [Cavia porcellus]|uniref:anoctamin-9 isoform X3 n=1 Tax=Cavia porcellus TaxID=10141 RepID=UPI002FDFB309
MQTGWKWARHRAVLEPAPLVQVQGVDRKRGGLGTRKPQTDSQDEESFQVLVGTEGESFPLMEIGTCEAEPSEQWDFILVAKYHTELRFKQVERQKQFLEELKSKGFHVKVREDQKRVFFGIRADNRIFDLYRTLLMEPEVPASGVEPATPTTTRIRIVNFILNSKTASGDTFEDLVKDGVFEDKFPLHRGEEDLKMKWAQWRNMFQEQPIDAIREYFGEKVALYFAWLGWYTYMLVPAAVVGLIVFLSGFALFNSSQISKEICEAHDIFLCPIGDSDKYQPLSVTCVFAKLTHFFDNEGTVLFAIFMALWATVFLEIWKRQRARVVLHWDLYGWDEDQEEMALELINCPDYKLRRHQHSYLRSTIILVLSLLMICFMIGMAHMLVVYRVLAAALFSNLAWPFLGVTTAMVAIGAVVHYVTIIIMTKVNKYVALKLCDFEKPRTFSERESKFTVKFFTLQFFAHFSSLIYIAFILGRINGHPGKSTRLAGLWKLEECHLSGCMMDLFVQMAIIMGLKQTLSNCVEYLRPWFAYKQKMLWACWAGDLELQDWQRNYCLNPVTSFTLFDEFMEMMIQYGFTTIFVAAFPLAPLLAFFSNVVEIRLDAIKMVQLQRRLVPRKAKDIGTWLQVLEIIGVLAVIANGMVIAFTSEFIPRMIYKYRDSPCRREPPQKVDCLTGYVNHSLSVFFTKDFQDPKKMQASGNLTECRYRDYRNRDPNDKYNFTEQFWLLLAIRLAFVILFEHVALCIKVIAAWFVPDVPQLVKNKVLEEKYDVLQEKLRSSSKSTDV